MDTAKINLGVEVRGVRLTEQTAFANEFVEKIKKLVHEHRMVFKDQGEVTGGKTGRNKSNGFETLMGQCSNETHYFPIRNVLIRMCIEYQMTLKRVVRTPDVRVDIFMAVSSKRRSDTLYTICQLYQRPVLQMLSYGGVHGTFNVAMMCNSTNSGLWSPDEIMLMPFTRKYWAELNEWNFEWGSWVTEPAYRR